MKRLINLENTTIPLRYKKALASILDYIEANPNATFRRVILFGSLARSSITCRSDIDICITLQDNAEQFTKELSFYKSELRSLTEVDLDIVLCSEETYTNSPEPLFRNIRKDGRVLMTTE